MTYVSKDELFDTVEENVAPLHREIGKAVHNFEAQMAALELRVERHLHRPKGHEVSPYDFNALRDDVEELTDIVKKQGEVLKRVWAAVEELSLNVSD